MQGMPDIKLDKKLINEIKRSDFITENEIYNQLHSKEYLRNRKLAYQQINDFYKTNDPLRYDRKDSLNSVNLTEEYRETVKVYYPKLLVTVGLNAVILMINIVLSDLTTIENQMILGIILSSFCIVLILIIYLSIKSGSLFDNLRYVSTRIIGLIFSFLQTILFVFHILCTFYLVLNMSNIELKNKSHKKDKDKNHNREFEFVLFGLIILSVIIIAGIVYIYKFVLNFGRECLLILLKKEKEVFNKLEYSSLKKVDEDYQSKKNIELHNFSSVDL